MRPRLGIRRRYGHAHAALVATLCWRHTHNFTFIHVNKTGGTSVGRALGLPFRHRSARQERDEFGEGPWSKRFTFAFVRNPWDRAVSLYSFRVGRGHNRRDGEVIPFPEWVDLTFGPNRPSDGGLMEGPQLAWLTDTDGTQLVDFVGRFERLPEDFAHVCRIIGREDATLPHLKSSSRAAYPDYYDDRTRQIIADWFAPDIEAFGYTFDGGPAGPA